MISNAFHICEPIGHSPHPSLNHTPYPDAVEMKCMFWLCNREEDGAWLACSNDMIIISNTLHICELISHSPISKFKSYPLS
jgi:hypothetical protein